MYNIHNILTSITKYKYYDTIDHSEIMNQDINFKNDDNDETIICDYCGIILEACMCVCPYCGNRDKCECCILDATTGG
jgi:hypothetical protein